MKNRKLVNFKLDILLEGLDCDFRSLRKKKNISNYRVNKIRVSDRHFIDPKSDLRKYIPDEISIETDNFKTISKIYYNEKSNLLLKYSNKEDCLCIVNKKNLKRYPFKLNFIPLKGFAKRIITLPSGRKIKAGEIVTPVSIDRLSINPFDGCTMWLKGKQCKFCGANPNRVIGPKIKPSVNDLKNYKSVELWWKSNKKDIVSAVEQSFKLLIREEFEPHLHLTITTGYLYGYEWEILLDLLEKVKPYIDLSKVDSHLTLMPPKSMEVLKRAKRLGIKNVAYNLEVFQKTKFKEICPGKDLEVEYEDFINWLKKSVKVFGWGNVRTNFVLGLENPKKLIQGCQQLAKYGIVSDYTIFYRRPASVIQTTSRDTLNKKDIIEFTEKLMKIYKKYRFKPFTCRLSSRTSIANDLFGDDDGS